jgi:hypothetical protein
VAHHANADHADFFHSHSNTQFSERMKSSCSLALCRISSEGRDNRRPDRSYLEGSLSMRPRLADQDWLGDSIVSPD